MVTQTQLRLHTDTKLSLNVEQHLGYWKMDNVNLVWNEDGSGFVSLMVMFFMRTVPALSCRSGRSPTS